MLFCSKEITMYINGHMFSSLFISSTEIQTLCLRWDKQVISTELHLSVNFNLEQYPVCINKIIKTRI